jgi:predicted DNA-binding protein (MmcQ/YjbR family)
VDGNNTTALQIYDCGGDYYMDVTHYIMTADGKTKEEKVFEHITISHQLVSFLEKNNLFLMTNT